MNNGIRLIVVSLIFVPCAAAMDMYESENEEELAQDSECYFDQAYELVEKGKISEAYTEFLKRFESRAIRNCAAADTIKARKVWSLCKKKVDAK